MTITSVVEQFPRPTGKSLQDGLYGTRKYQLISDIVDELEAAVYSACPVNLGDLFPGTLTAQCTEQTGEQDKDSRDVWYVTCQYKSILNQTEQSRIDFPNPLDRRARIEWGSRTVMTPVTRMQRAASTLLTAYQAYTTAYAFDGKPYSVTNTARDPFDPGVEVPITEWIASVTKNLTTPPGWILTYDNAVNADVFTIDGLSVPKGCAKLEGLKLGSIMKENGTVFRQLSYNVVLKSYREARDGETDLPEPWDVEVLNEGMRTWGTSKWTNVLDSAGQAVSKPVPFDTLGLPISPSGAPIPESSLYWILFRPFKRKTFTGILPLT